MAECHGVHRTHAFRVCKVLICGKLACELWTHTRHTASVTTTTTTTTTTTQARFRFLFVKPVSVESPVVDMPVHGEHAVPHVCGESASCAHSGATSRWQSRWSWLRCNTIRTAFYGTRGQPPGPGERPVMYCTAKFRERLLPKRCWLAGAGPVAHRRAHRRRLAVRANARCACAADGGTVGGHLQAH